MFCKHRKREQNQTVLNTVKPASWHQAQSTLHIQYYADVCVHGGLHCRRKAGASKWTKSGLSGPCGSSWLLFRGPKNGAKNRPQKTGPQYYRKKERLPKWRPHFWDQGVAYTVSPPLRAVSSGDFGTFRLFSCQLA